MIKRAFSNVTPRPNDRARLTGESSKHRGAAQAKTQEKHHNCCGGGGECGYKWCKLTSKCERYGDCKIGGDKDSDGCYIAAGETWCSKQGKCTHPWEC